MRFSGLAHIRNYSKNNSFTYEDLASICHFDLIPIFIVWIVSGVVRAAIIRPMERIGGELLKEKEGIMLSEKGKEILEDTAFLWAMALDKEGCVVWEWKLPKEIPENYTLQEVASFSRWYLKDYPVRIWRSEELLLVFGCSPERVTRYDVMMSAETFEFLPVYIKAMVFANFMVILLFIVFFGFQFYRSMKPLVEGVEMLALGKRTDIKEKGSMGELAAKLNLVSKRLEQQQEQLSKRDEARTEIGRAHV